jgi:hypothetical protein
MRFQVFLSIALMLLVVLQGGCLGNAPNPRKTFGDHVALVADSVTDVVLYVPGAALLVVWLAEQQVTALIRSDGGGHGGEAEAERDPCAAEEAEPAEFPPPAGDASGCGGGQACG